MGKKLDGVSIHGPTLAVLLQSVLSGDRCCDGVLLGSVTTATHAKAEDDVLDAVDVTVRTALVTGALACSATGSFYGGDGAVDGAKLAEICRSAAGLSSGSSGGGGGGGGSGGAAALTTPQGSVLGWFSYRPGMLPIGAPSMREAAVTLSLQRHLAATAAGAAATGNGSKQGAASAAAAAATTSGATSSGRDEEDQAPGGDTVFMLLTSGTGHGGATLSVDYRAFQVARPAAAQAPAPLGVNSGSGSGISAMESGAVLEPLEVTTINLAEVLSAAHTRPPFAAPALAAALAAGGGGSVLPSALERRLRDSASSAACDAVEGVCGAMLGELKNLSEAVGAASASLAAARERNARLIARLAAVSDADGACGAGEESPFSL